MLYFIVAIIIFIIAYIYTCVIIKRNLINIDDFDDFLFISLLVFVVSLLWIISIPATILLGIAYYIYVYITER